MIGDPPPPLGEEDDSYVLGPSGEIGHIVKVGRGNTTAFIDMRNFSFISLEMI